MSRPNSFPSTPSSKPVPVYPDDITRLLSERLEEATSRRRSLRDSGFSTAEIDAEILDLRHRIREGGQLRAGDLLGAGRYLLIDLIGRGGFSNVWKAHDTERDELVAIKVLRSDIASDPVRRSRFFRGARVMSEITHPAVVPILEPHGEDGGYHYCVMRLVCGCDLRRAVLDGKIQGQQAVMQIVFRVGEALAQAHARGQVHRDIKPANILLDESLSPYLTDFDLVRAVDTTGDTQGGALGTFVYAAPELMSHPEDADSRADVYSLAMTTVFALRGSELPGTVLRDLDRIIDELDCDPRLKDVLRKALVPDEGAERYADAGEFCSALQEALTPVPSFRWPQLSSKSLWALALATVSASSLGLLVGSRPSVAPKVQPWMSSVIKLALVEQDALKKLIERRAVMDKLAGPMVLIPAGSFRMGSETGELNERPVHLVHLEAFEMDRTEVTVTAFRACVQKGACLASTSVEWSGYTDADKRIYSQFCNWQKSGRDEHPINCVDWTQANAFCQWAGKRLPTEEEWEYAARGTDGRIYPWGNESPGPTLVNLCGSDCRLAAVRREGHGLLLGGLERSTSTTPVGSYASGKSPFGLLDMAGNVWEWTSSGYSEDYTKVREYHARVARGGSWFSGPSYLRSTYRYSEGPSYRFDLVGFRCARDLL